MEETKEIKLHLLKTATELLESGKSPEDLTVRNLAKESHVAIGLINYHFGSKENLLIEAVDGIVKRITQEELRGLNSADFSPSERLIAFLETISKVVLKYKHYSQYLLKHQNVSKKYETPAMIVSALKEINPDADDYEIKWTAVQIVAPLQFVLLNEEGFNEYMGQSNLDFEKLFRIHLKQLGIISN